MQRLPQILVILSAIAFGGLGIVFLTDPARLAGTVELGTSPFQTIELRAMYGGLELGVALFLLWCAAAPKRVELGLWFSLFAFAGLGLGRLAGILLSGVAGGPHWMLVTIEAAAVLLSLVGLTVIRRRRFTL